jgi:predicted nucleotidyltransferase
VLGSSSRIVHAELKNLASIDLIRKRISGNQHYYSANTAHPIFQDLQNIFRKTTGLKDVLEEQLSQYGERIEFAFIYGSFASGDFTAGSDVDVMIIGEVTSRKISSVLLKAGESLEREINFSVFPKNEFVNRLKINDHFITRVIEKPLLFLIGEENDFRNLAQQWMAERA